MSIKKRNSVDSWKPIIFGYLGSIVFLLLMCGLLYWLPQLSNNQQLKVFASHLYDYPLPPRSEVVSRHSEIGLIGNGNHCDFLAEQTILTYLSPSEIESYYEKVDMPPAREESRKLRLPVIVQFSEQPPNDKRLLFTIILMNQGYDPGLDIRCH